MLFLPRSSNLSIAAIALAVLVPADHGGGGGSGGGGGAPPTLPGIGIGIPGSPGSPGSGGGGGAPPTLPGIGIPGMGGQPVFPQGVGARHYTRSNEFVCAKKMYRYCLEHNKRIHWRRIRAA